MKEVRELQCSRRCANEFPVYPLPGFYDIALVELFFTEPPTAHKAMAANVGGERLAQTMYTVYLSRLRHDALVRILRLTLSLPCQLKKI